jgi:hypothetical protein
MLAFIGKAVLPVSGLGNIVVSAEFVYPLSQGVVVDTGQSGKALESLRTFSQYQ